MDSVQLVLFIVIIILAALLIVLGIQVYFILKDLRKTISKTNRVLDDAAIITENVTGPISDISSLVSTLKAGSVLTVVKIIKGILSKDGDDERRRRD